MQNSVTDHRYYTNRKAKASRQKLFILQPVRQLAGAPSKTYAPVMWQGNYYAV